MGLERLAVVSTHPVQYHAPVYREVERLGLPVTAIYGSDFSVAGYHDREFDVAFSWSSDLLSGYSSIFLSRVAEGGARSPSATSSRGLARALWRLRPDAVLLTGYWPAYLRHAALQLLLQRHRILFRAETTDHAQQRAGLVDAGRDFVLRHYYSRCSALLYIGKRSRMHFERLGAGEERLYFAPYCVDRSTFASEETSRDQFRTAVRLELGIPSDQTVLLFMGKLVHRKGPDLLLDAIEGMSATIRKRITIIFVGDGEMRESLAARSRVINQRFVGFQNQDQLSPYYHASDALVLPSRSGETWGLVVNEALLHGVPCVVSQGVGCGPDLVIPGATGEIFETDCSSALRDAINRMLAWRRNEVEPRQICRRQVARYSVNAAARGIIAAFESSASGGAAVRDTAV